MSNEIPQGLCSKCHEGFMNCKCDQFHPNIEHETDKFLFAQCYEAISLVNPELATRFFNFYKPIQK